MPKSVMSSARPSEYLVLLCGFGLLAAAVGVVALSFPAFAPVAQPVCWFLFGCLGLGALVAVAICRTAERARQEKERSAWS